ncbi:MAG: insulinase family protein [Candidatus Cloacimonetes bacterium]|nr:insulinase family protein [Candidatus Cloacimonadota bacterium]
MNTFQNLKSYHLENGTKVYLQPETHHNLVTFQVWYGVGARFESPKNYGVSHFIEHLFFKGTKKYGPGIIDKKLNEIGAFNNAATSKDYTFYYTFGVADKFEEMFEIQSEMLINPSFDPDEIDKERKVVIAEINRANDTPERIFYYHLMDQLYQSHPYSKPVLGFENIIENISREDIVEYHQSHYHPNNTNIVLVGNFDEAKARSMIESTFGKIANEGYPVAKTKMAVMPEPSKKTYYSKIKRNLSNFAFMGPDGNQIKDIVALDLLSTILTDGKSSRWTKHFKEDLNLVEALSFSHYTSHDKAPILIYARVKDNQWLEYHKEMKICLDKLRKFYVSREELHLAKQYELNQSQYYWQKMRNRAQSIGFYASMDQVDVIKNHKTLISSITQEDIIRVIEKYLSSEPILTQMLPEESQVEPQTSQEEIHPLKYTTKEISTNITHIQFDSGLQLVFNQDKSSEICLANLTLNNLSEFTNRFPPGTCYLMQKLLSRGTSSASQEKIAQSMDLLGAKYSTIAPASQSRKDTYRNQLLAPQNSFWEAFSTFCSFFTDASFPESEIQKSKENILQEIKAMPDALSSYCMYHLLQNFFEGHPYETPFIGTSESVSQLSRKDINDLYSVMYNPQNMTLFIGGNFTLEEVIEKAHQFLNKKLGGLNYSLGELKVPNTFVSKRENTIDSVSSTKEQSYLMPAWLVPGIQSEQYPTALLINEILGGGMSSRFFHNMRDEKSYGYEIGSSYISYKNYGVIFAYLGTDPHRVNDASEDFKKEVRSIQQEGVSIAELGKAKQLLLSKKELSQETMSDRLSSFANLFTKGMSVTQIQNYKQNLLNVTPKMIQSFAKEHLVNPFEQRVEPKKQ